MCTFVCTNYGRGGEIRTHDPLRPRHRNVPHAKLRKLRIFNALVAHRLHPRWSNVVEFVADDSLRTLQLARTRNRAPAHR